jgi:hypothetical protein
MFQIKCRLATPIILSKLWSENLKERDHLKDLGIDMRIGQRLMGL